VQRSDLMNRPTLAPRFGALAVLGVILLLAASAHAASSPNAASPLGINLNGIDYYSAEMPFIDNFKSSGGWITHSSAVWDTNEERYLKLDANGWPISLGAVGLASKLREPTSALSGGEQQRVAIARALIQAPRLLLADEPVASLDPKTAEEVLDLLSGLTRARGMALICSLHQPELARRYFDRIIEVRAGALVEVGLRG